MTIHSDFDTLDDLAAGTLTGADREAAERHLAVCDECRARVTSLRDLLARTHALPLSIEPPAELWADVRSAIGRYDRFAARATARGSRAWWRRSSVWLLAAAALVLVASSSAITALLLRRQAVAAAVGEHPVSPNARPAALPANLAIVEAGYDNTARELEAALDAQRSRLAPRTIATVERSLAVIDAAIAEAKRALIDDPSNRALVDIFAANYEHKLELLRRATELTSSI